MIVLSAFCENLINKTRTISSIWLCAMVCLGVLHGCTSEKIGIEESRDDGLLHLTFSMEGLTKADVGADGSGNFSEGDKVGLYIGNGDETQYRELTYAGGLWTPQLRRSDFGSGELTLSAHFPADRKCLRSRWRIFLDHSEGQWGRDIYGSDTSSVHFCISERRRPREEYL